MRAASSAAAILVSALTCAALAAAARDTFRPLKLRIYDPAGQIRAAVRAADVVRPSARATREPDGSGALSFRLTKHGVATFHILTRGLARRGARLHKRQAFVLEINHKSARPEIDYRVSPDGVDASGGLEVSGMPFSVARMLAQAIRGT
jgi:hypothetical protein